MTPDTPNSADLLGTAMDVLKTDLLPLLPESAKLDALMVLAVMAAAERDLQDCFAETSLTDRQAQRLASLLPAGESVAHLCALIRQGRFDKPKDAERLTAVLLADVRDRLSLVNPKYLASADDVPGDSVP